MYMGTCNKSLFSVPVPLISSNSFSFIANGENSYLNNLVLIV